VPAEEYERKINAILIRALAPEGNVTRAGRPARVKLYVEGFAT